MRLSLLALAVGATLTPPARAERAVIRVTEIASPAPKHSLGPSWAVDTAGRPWLSWIETNGAPAPTTGHQHGHASAGTGANAIALAEFDPATNAWRPAQRIVTSETVSPSSSDIPLVAFGSERLHALWTDGHGGAWRSHSANRGASWSAPEPWTKRSAEVEKFALARLADGRVLAAWLDGRDKKAGGQMQQLRARVIDAADDSEILVDGSVCDCCQTTLAPLLDGGALLAYRGRAAQEVRDIFVARFNGKTWAEPRLLNADDWRINGCPVNGPRLASDGSRVAAAWFTAADNTPRVLASYSPDASARWLNPLRIDRGQPAGHVDTVLLHDGALLATWLENDGSLWLRRITPEFSATDPVALAPKGTALGRSHPRLALLQDYAGGRSAAELAVAFTGDGDNPGVRVLRIVVPEGDLIAQERNCDCAPTVEQLSGFAIRGAVVAADVTTNTLRIRHAEVPGIFSAGSHEFKVEPVMLTKVQIGFRFLGRIDRRDGAWWLTDVQLLGSPALPGGR